MQWQVYCWYYQWHPSKKINKPNKQKKDQCPRSFLDSKFRRTDLDMLRESKCTWSEWLHPLSTCRTVQWLPLRVLRACPSVNSNIRLAYLFRMPCVLGFGLQIYLYGKMSCYWMFLNLHSGYPAVYMWKYWTNGNWSFWILRKCLACVLGKATMQIWFTSDPWCKRKSSRSIYSPWTVRK